MYTRKTSRTLSVLIATAALLWGFHAWSAECVDITMADTITVNGTTLTLNGLGLREATALNVDVYVAGLYVESTSTDGSTLINTDQTARLALRFVRDVDGDDITDAFTEGFAGNAGSYLMSNGTAVEQLNSWMSDVEDGDTMVFTYIPGAGTEVEVDGNSRGTIASHEFFSAFISIWLGPDPPNGGLKRGLLGGECD